ncbi:MAG TPA: ATP synthase subunit F [Clostridiales bacterium]|nr:ATP synthase subunit F [Clostridiales bacterium]
MKLFLISDNVDTLVGMRLAGIKGVLVHEKDEVLQALKNAKAQGDVGIILITEKLYLMVKDYLDEQKLKTHIPLIVEIPDRHGTVLKEERITRYIREAIGLKI